MQHSLTKRQAKGMDSFQVILSLLSEISAAAKTSEYTKETNILDVYLDVGSTAWLEFYERLERIYGSGFWGDKRYNTLGDICDRIYALQRKNIVKRGNLPDEQY